jgi:hypothetical protein
MTTKDSNQVVTSTSAPRPLGRWRAIVVGAVLVLGAACAIFENIESRVEAKAELHKVAMNSAVSSVNVVFPRGGTEAEEIELPGNTQASFLLSSRHRSWISNCNRPRLS